jgi:putative sugar O-methyltransferase
MATSGISAFWQTLSSEHRRQLERFGFGEIKRRQAFKYFNWNWRWSAVSKSEQLRFLLRHSTLATQLLCAVMPPAMADAAWEGAPLGRADRWLYTFAVRLLWEFAHTQDIAGVLELPEPALGAPPPVYHRGRLISQDLANTALEVATIQRGLGDAAPTHILEIGAGYGRVAYALLKLFPEARYTIIDIEPALSISRWYLTSLFPGRTLDFVDASGASAADLTGVSLAISISSLQEMTPDDVASYLRLIDANASGGFVFLKQWTEWRNPVDGVTLRFTEYPIPARWRLVFAEPPPVQTRFTQAFWRVP